MSIIKKHRVALIGAVGLVLGIGIWTYSILNSSDSTSNPPKKKARTGPKTLITLSTSILPPIATLQLLLESYTVHLLLPAKQRFLLPPEIQLLLESNGGKLLFHETGEGVIHMARVLGGIFISIEPNVEGNKIGNEIERMPNGRLVNELARFVGTTVFVTKDEESKEKMIEAVGVESRNLKIVVQWEGLERLLGV